MRVEFNKSGAERKALVTAIGDSWNQAKVHGNASSGL